MEHEAERCEDRLEHRISQQGTGEPARHVRHRERTDRHATEIDCQHEHLGEGAVSHEEREVSAPQHLVDQPGHTRKNEGEVKCGTLLHSASLTAVMGALTTTEDTGGRES